MKSQKRGAEIISQLLFVRSAKLDALKVWKARMRSTSSLLLVFWKVHTLLRKSQQERRKRGFDAIYRFTRESTICALEQKIVRLESIRRNPPRPIDYKRFVLRPLQQEGSATQNSQLCSSL